jgi:uncharacterized protein (DUF2252 family)
MPIMPPAKADEVATAIDRFNAGRDPERLAMKLAKMAQSPFVFLRGACHLFYDSLPQTALFRDAPLAWCCGDLHFENFGSYKADNRLVYFDINDFDEAALAPATWDIVRLLCSIECGADEIKATRAQAQAASANCLAAYRHALGEGKSLWVERETSVGLVKSLLTGLQSGERSVFLDKRSVKKGGRRVLKVDGGKALPATAADKLRVSAFLDEFAAAKPEPGFPRFFELVDVARRIAGTGSLGVERFVVLVEGKGSPDRNYLLDLKEARPSALAPHLARLGIRQPTWADEAVRVVAVQRRMQAVEHAFLQPVRFADRPFILRGLQASEDRVAIGEWSDKAEKLDRAAKRGGGIDRLGEVVSTMGRLLAWDQLRACGRSGSASADELIAFAQRDDWVAPLLAAASALSETTRQQWQAFVHSQRARGAAGA